MSKINDFIASIVLPELFNPTMTEDKNDIFKTYVLDMLSRTLEMFEYEGLPETLSARSIEIELQTRGFAVITKVDKPLHGEAGLYCIRTASVGGELNAERLPTLAICNDPWLNYSESLKIGEDCVVIANDNLWRGLGGLFSLNAGQLADAETTMRLQLYNSRINKILTATDDKVVEDAKTFLTSIKDGKWAVIGDEVEMAGLMKALSSIDFTSPHSGSIKDTMEVLQYYRAQWFIALGLNDNFNMKREALNGSETESNENTLFALPLMMLKYREEGIKKVNEMYGAQISVKFGSTWETAYQKYLLSLKAKEAELAKIINPEPMSGNQDNPTDKPEDKPEDDKPEDKTETEVKEDE